MSKKDIDERARALAAAGILEDPREVAVKIVASAMTDVRVVRVDGPMTYLSARLEPGRLDDGDLALAQDRDGSTHLWRAICGRDGIAWVSLGVPDGYVVRAILRHAREVIHVTQSGVM